MIFNALYEGDVMRLCDSVRILQLWCHIEGNIRCINLDWAKYDVTDGLGVKCTPRHCGTVGGGALDLIFKPDVVPLLLLLSFNVP